MAARLVEPLDGPQVSGPKSPLQELAGHHHALDLVGALVDLGDRGPGAVSAGRWRVGWRGVSTDPAPSSRGPRGPYTRARMMDSPALDSPLLRFSIRVTVAATVRKTSAGGVQILSARWRRRLGQARQLLSQLPRAGRETDAWRTSARRRPLRRPNPVTRFQSGEPSPCGTRLPPGHGARR